MSLVYVTQHRRRVFFVQEVVDAEPHVDDVSADGPAVLGELKHLERRSRGALMIRISEFHGLKRGLILMPLSTDDDL